VDFVCHLTDAICDPAVLSWLQLCRKMLPQTVVMRALPVPFRPIDSLVATSALFRLAGIRAISALATTPKVDAFTARCGACSLSRFLFRCCLFSCRCFLWLMVARNANSYNFKLLVHPLANPTLITFLGLDGLMFHA
jgi:hypothetical protein